MAARKSAARGRGPRTARKTGVKAQRKGKSTQGARKSKAAKSGKGTAPKLYTLTEVGRMASVSMPTLQKYKKLYAARIPSVGEGRKQRYPREAVAVLRQLKKENLAKRGRPPKAGSKAKKSTAKRSSKSSGLLTLTEISRRTKISYPTVSRYVKLFSDRIPHVGTGRKRRFPPEAVAAFLELRKESRPGRPPRAGARQTSRGAAPGTAAISQRLQKLERAQAELSRQVAAVVKLLNKPLQVTIKRR